MFDYYDDNFKDLSLTDKWRVFYQYKKAKGGQSKALLYGMRGLLAFQAPTELYFFLHYFIPYFMDQYDEWTQYCCKVFICFLCIQGLANYLCCLLYDTSYIETKDRPELTGINDRWNNPPERFTPMDRSIPNGHVPYDEEKLEWSYCKTCKFHIPPRAHHCKTCKKCILKRDHHCYMVGTCIGYKNQRYFVVLSFYAFVVGAIGFHYTYNYLKFVYWPIGVSIDYFLPITFFKMMIGTIPVHVAIMIFHMYTEAIFGLLGLIYFVGQIVIIAQGKTLYELAQALPIKSTTSVNANFVSVFGHFWLLNFVFPMPMVFKQIGDGTKWEGVKVLHSSAKKVSIV